MYQNIIAQKMQITNTNEMVFHEETDTFQLTVTFNEKKLKICLKDYVDWRLYESQYTSKNIGEDINQKMDLFDIFRAFSQSKSQNNEENQQASRGSQDSGDSVVKYQFGTIVWHQKLPRYKIEREGRITTYLTILDVQSTKCHIYQSNLKLKHSERLSKVQVFQKKWMLEKYQLVKKRQEEQLYLYGKIVKLEDENKNYIKITKLRLILFFIFLGLLWWIYHEYFYIDRFRKLEQKMKSIKKTAPYTNLPQLNMNDFELDGNKLRYIGQNDTWTHYIFNNPIYLNHQGYFKIKITVTQRRYMIIGIVDYVKQKNQRSSWSSGNSICYNGYNGYKFPLGGYEGRGFSQGDEIQVFVDRANFHVRYAINGTIKATHFHQMLSDSSRVFMPFIDMYHTNDQVEWDMEAGP